jgi:hypothetical protein
MSLSKLLKKTCIVERPTTTIDSYRNTTLTWNVLSSSVKCYLYYFNESGKINIGISGESLSDLRKGFFLPTTDIKERDRIYYEGAYYYVKFKDSIVNANSGTTSHIECLLSTEEV